MAIGNYTLKIKELCDSLGSINVNIDDDEMVQICLGGLAPLFDAIRSTIFVRQNPLSFFDLRVSWYRINPTPSELATTDFDIDSEEDNRLRPISEESPI